MIFWVFIAAVSIALAFALARPLLRPAPAAQSRADFDATVYRDQLTEIDRDRARGILSDEQAAAARLEVERRLLATADVPRATEKKPARSSPSPLVAGGVALGLPVLALVLYAQLGTPHLPGQPFADRRPSVGGQQTAQGEAHPGGGPNGSMEELADRLAKRMEANPNDPDGWSLLARSYQQLGKHREAVVALERAVQLTNRDPAILANLGEARIMVADGTVPPQARAEFEEALVKLPKDPRSRFYIALAEAQGGNLQGGLDRLVALAKDTPPDAPYLEMVRERIGGLARELKQDPNRVLAGLPIPVPEEPAAQPPPQRAQQPAQAPPAQAPGQAARQERGPTASDVAAAQQMSSADRQQMIRGMVDGLATRLESEPGDIEGWLKLIRAYKVLGEDQKAVDATGKAIASNPLARPRIASAAQGMGIQVAAAPPAQPAPQPAAQAAPSFDVNAVRAGNAVPPDQVATLRQRLQSSPNDRVALWQVGLAEAQSGNRLGAAELWGRLLGQLDPASAEYAAVRARLDGLKQGG